MLVYTFYFATTSSKELPGYFLATRGEKSFAERANERVSLTDLWSSPSQQPLVAVEGGSSSCFSLSISLKTAAAAAAGSNNPGPIPINIYPWSKENYCSLETLMPSYISTEQCQRAWENAKWKTKHGWLGSFAIYAVERRATRNACLPLSFRKLKFNVLIKLYCAVIRVGQRRTFSMLCGYLLRTWAFLIKQRIRHPSLLSGTISELQGIKQQYIICE